MSILSDEAINWLANGQRGSSSNTMFMRFTGIDTGSNKGSHPSDPDDFRRCELLLRRCPEFRECVSALADLSDVWARLVYNWELIATTFEQEIPGIWDEWPRGIPASKTYDLMKQIIGDRPVY